MVCASRTTLFYLWLALVFLTLPGITPAASQSVAPQRWEGVEKIVAFGDVHGAYGALVELLNSLEIIDDREHWIGGTTHLVSLGDLLDRGDDSRQVMDLMMSLQAQAAASGGRVHMVLGNHEIMNLTGDLRYASAQEYAAFAADETAQEREQGLALLNADLATEQPTQDVPAGFFAHRRAFSPEGQYGSWLLGLPTIIVINDNAFVHGGMPLWMNEYSATEVNQAVRRDLDRLLSEAGPLMAAGTVPANVDLLDVRTPLPENHPLIELRESRFLTDESPMWYRGTAHCHQLIEAPRVERALEHFAVSRLFLGHSPTTTRQIQQRFAGSVVLADTGMLASYYQGQPSAVVIAHDTVTAVYPNQESATTVIAAPPADERAEPASAALLLELRTMVVPGGNSGEPVAATVGGRNRQVFFQPGERRVNNAREAAYRLDRMLGLGMVPVTVQRRVDGVAGTLALLPARTLTESERLQQGLYRPRWCEPIPDYQLMYAFDGLIRNENRTQSSLLYDRANWSLLLLLEGTAFSSRDQLPAHLEQVPQVLPRGLANVLARMDFDALHNELEPLLSKRAIRGMDERRLLLLNDWSIED